MKEFKRAEGITLVALIITIVVLLILAIVAIGAVKESNIIAHAENASNSYTIAQEKEQIGLALSEWNIEKVIPGNNPVFENIITGALQGQIEPVPKKSDEILTITFIKTGNVYEVKKDGTITQIMNDVINPENPVKPEEPVVPEPPLVQTAKAYDFSSIAEGTLLVMSPDASEFAAFAADSVLPVGTGTYIDLSYFDDKSVKLVISDKINYNKIMAIESIELFLLLSEDGKIYLPELDGNNLVFSEDMYFEPSTTIDASKYYKEDSMFYYYPEITKDWIRQAECIACIDPNSLKVYNIETNQSYDITDDGVVSADEVIKVKANREEVEIGAGAQKLIINYVGSSVKLNAYIQDDKLYFTDTVGTINNFINTDLLPAE